MAAERRHTQIPSFAVQPDRPLIGIVQVDGDQETVRYFADEADADAAATTKSIAEAHALAGAWADLDWDEAADALDRIRHESEPTAPIEAL